MKLRVPAALLLACTALMSTGNASAAVNSGTGAMGVGIRIVDACAVDASAASANDGSGELLPVACDSGTTPAIQACLPDGVVEAVTECAASPQVSASAFAVGNGQLQVLVRHAGGTDAVTTEVDAAGVVVSIVY